MMGNNLGPKNILIILLQDKWLTDRPSEKWEMGANAQRDKNCMKMFWVAKNHMPMKIGSTISQMLTARLGGLVVTLLDFYCVGAYA